MGLLIGCDMIGTTGRFKGWMLACSCDACPAEALPPLPAVEWSACRIISPCFGDRFDCAIVRRSFWATRLERNSGEKMVR